jgi:hypothetical protein
MTKKSKIQIIVAKDKTGDFYKLRDGKVVQKNTIVNQMKEGQHYNDAKGSKVSFERINGQNYLRAVHDESKIDNLKNLPIFDRHKTHHEAKKSKIQIIVAKDKTGDFYKLRDGKVVHKETIVKQMEAGQHYNDAKGSKVSFERINGQNYLRAVHDESKIDNLKNLPIFDRHKTHHEDVSHPTTTHTHYHLPLTTFDTTSNTRRVSERLGTLGYLAIGFALLALVLCLLFGFLFEMRTSSGTSITPRASSSVLDFSTVTQGLFLFGWTVYSNGTYSIT